MDPFARPYDWLYARTRAGRERGPERARALLNQLGAPDAQFDTVRVIGTNGKGSVCAMLEAGLLAAGERVGRFTSPHLARFEERIRIGGRELDPSRTAEFVRWAQEHAPDAAFFDLTLALACAEFAAAGVAWAVMEAGVGGASDATQALGNVRAVCITNAQLDHTATLGPTIGRIAAEKARAAQPGVPLLTSAEGEALEVMARVAREAGAPLYTPASHPELFRLPHPPRMEGAHQASNAALALAALRLLGFQSGLEAALGATFPGRLERFTVQGREVLLDGAHNPHAAQALAGAIGPIHTLLFGGLERKDTAATLAPLLDISRVRVYTVPGDLAADPQALVSSYGGQAEPDPLRALALALALTPPGERLLVTGSLYLVGVLRGRLTP